MTHQCECIETAIRELLQGNGYDMRIIDGQYRRAIGVSQRSRHQRRAGESRADGAATDGRQA